MFRSLIVVTTLSVLCLVVILSVTFTWNRPVDDSVETASSPVAANHAKDPPVRVSPQARHNLGIVARPLELTTYWKTIEVPGILRERPGLSDCGVVAPVTGVVAEIYHFPGDTVRPDAALFRIRLASESVHTSQRTLYRTTQELEIARSQLERISEAAESGALARSRFIEIENEIRRLNVAIASSKQDLQMRGFTSDMIAAVANGNFVTEVTVRAPQLSEAHVETFDTHQADFELDLPHQYEVHSLGVELGQQVEVGDLLTQLADHCALMIEGCAFKNDVPWIHSAAKEGWEVEVDFGSEEAGDWPAIPGKFPIHHVANLVDPVSNTFAFYLILENQFQEFQSQDGANRRLWRFRPGSRVRLRVPVEKMEGVFVLPRGAVAQEGPEAYVFRQNGDLFDRFPVRLLHEDRLFTVLANDGNVRPGYYIAQSSAASLNRILKAQSASGLPTNFHVHADGTVHEAH